jgi:rhodanese-related sulfurtransferase
MKVRLFLLSMVLGVVSFANAQTVKTVAAAEFEKKAAAMKDKIILDVRTAEEYKDGHLVGSIQIDYYGSDFKNEVSKLDKSKPVFVYCKGGGRSSSSCAILKDLGFKEVYNLQGGITDWKKAGRAVIK